MTPQSAKQPANQLARQPLSPIHVPDDWHDHDLLTFEQFCTLIQTPARTVRDWRRRHVGPRWTKPEGTGRLYITAAEIRRFLHATTGNRNGPTIATRPEEPTA